MSNACCYRDSEGVGSQTEGLTSSQYGACGRRNQERLLDCCIWCVKYKFSEGGCSRNVTSVKKPLPLPHHPD